MRWVNPDYVREVRADGGITYRRRGYEIDHVEIDDGPPIGMENFTLGPLESAPWLPEAVWDAAREPRDIVDEIDALVDGQLAGGPVDDYNADRYDRCPHCGRHWHGLPITACVAAMYDRGRFDEDYVAAEDDSRVLCEGSDVIGPMPAQPGGDLAGHLAALAAMLLWPNPYPPVVPFDRSSDANLAAWTYPPVEGAPRADPRRPWTPRVGDRVNFVRNGETLVAEVSNVEVGEDGSVLVSTVDPARSRT